MALIKCPEGGNDISDRAPACIYCGYPISVENHQTKGSYHDKADTQNGAKTKVKCKKVRKKMALWKKILIAIVSIGFEFTFSQCLPPL